MKTKLNYYNFNLAKPDEARAWSALQAQIIDTGVKCFSSHSNRGKHKNESIEVELDTKCLFDNQWNTTEASGDLRIFDWWLAIYPNRSIMEGHWITQTDEMIELRKNVSQCGYCGHAKPTGEFDFCPDCFGGEYITEENLIITRMRRVCDSKLKHKPLTAKEKEWLIPRFMEAQIHGNTEQDVARIAGTIKDLAASRDKVIERAQIQHDGYRWLMSKGVRTANCIYYDHTNEFCFGWRQPLSAELKAKLDTAMADFPFTYTVKTLS